MHCLQRRETGTGAPVVSITEGLLHLLNEKGYPRHSDPATATYLKLCADLFYVPSAGCYFYVNDIKIFVDLILRELANIMDTDYTIKHKYLILLGALVSSAEYLTESYRLDDLMAALGSPRNCYNLTRNCHNLTRNCHNLTRIFTQVHSKSPRR